MRPERNYRHDATKNKMVKKYTIKEIFSDNRDDFVDEMGKQGKAMRPTIMEEVAKIIGCRDPTNGFALYSCPDCGVKKRVSFTCKSRFCNICGAKYSKDRALAMSKTLLKAPHRHDCLFCTAGRPQQMDNAADSRRAYTTQSSLYNRHSSVRSNEKNEIKANVTNG